MSELLRHRAQRQETARVGPVEVLDNHDHGGRARHRIQDIGHLLSYRPVDGSGSGNAGELVQEARL
ncbi:hypothetical protein ABZ468_38550 [Streptomyces sp. NPDC005708]|uniref:hypothetical protein n=1 Tax=Streptomyces sp. NPDC005708 TaxID=3154564 RepID=UPI0034062DF4